MIKALGLASALGLALYAIMFGLQFGYTATCAAAEAALPCGYARITGVITAADTGKPLANIAVLPIFPDGEFANSDTTDADGRYTLTYPATRGPTVKLRLINTKSYRGGPISGAAPFISGTTTVSNIVLPLGGTISGTLHTEDGGPIPQFTELYAVPLDNPDLGEIKTIVIGQQQNAFAIAGLPSGRYTLRFQISDTTGSYESGYLGGSLTLTDAQKIDLLAPAVREVSATLLKGATISGTITNATTGKPADDMHILLYNADTLKSVGLSSGTTSSGIYNVRGVPPGRYYVLAIPLQFGGSDLVGAFYGNTPFFSNATPVVVGEDDVGNVNVALPIGATIFGTVRDAVTGDPVPNVQVVLSSDPNGPHSDVFNVGTEGKTDAQGHYSVRGVLSGQYTVVFNSFLYVSQAYKEQDSFLNAQLITATNGVTITQIDASLHRGASLGGRVTDKQGNPLLVSVIIYRLQDGRPLVNAFASTKASGIYTATRLLPGDYIVQFKSTPPCGCYIDHYYGQTAASSPTIIHIDSYGQTSLGHDTQLGCDARPATTDASRVFVPLVRR